MADNGGPIGIDTSSNAVPAAIGGNRLEWSDLPDYLQREITLLAGSAVESSISQPDGFSPGLASRLRLDNGQRLFVKAISAQQTPEGPSIMRSEARVSRALPSSAPVPRLLWTHDDGTWVALGFEDVEGHQPTQPWAPNELNRVLDAIALLSKEMTPSPIDVVTIVESNANDFMTWRKWRTKLPNIDIDDIDPWILSALDLLADLESRWAAAATGETLLHGDLRADNILLTEDGVVFVDWPGAQIGAAWVDLLLMLPSAAMHGTDVQQIVEHHSLFRGVDANHVNAVIAAVSGYFIGTSILPPPPGLPAVRAFQLAQGRAALRWLRVRATISS